MKKKLLSVVLTAVMAASVLTGCGSTDNGTASTAAATGTAQSEAAATSAASTDGKVYNIGICQLVDACSHMLLSPLYNFLGHKFIERTAIH